MLVSEVPVMTLLTSECWINSNSKLRHGGFFFQPTKQQEQMQIIFWIRHPSFGMISHANFAWEPLLLVTMCSTHLLWLVVFSETDNIVARRQSELR